jgi:hypothetical protein
MYHGSADSLVPIDWGVSTHRALAAACGAASDLRFTRYDGVEHELVAEELRALEQFVLGEIEAGAV